MYLEKLYIENYGSIDKLDIDLSFNSDGTPKPIVLVGKNGSGKTLTISTIVESFFEFAKTGYKNAYGETINTLDSPFFRLSGGDSIRIGCSSSLLYCKFKTENSAKLEFLEKIGDVDLNFVRDNITNTLHFSNSDAIQKTVTNNKSLITDTFEKEVVCFFPPNRYEQPHWFNEITNLKQSFFDFNKKLANYLDKPILVQNSSDDNFKWFLDLFLDSKAEVILNENGSYDFVNPSMAHNNVLIRKGLENVETLLNLILETNNIKFSSGYRFQQRMSLTKDNNVIIPSISHLSTGQSLLLNMFATIIRYADMANLNNSINLSDIKGIVVIDEVDIHLHNDLLLSVLPKLIKQFPKVQFIMTTHSPLFLMGMDKIFGESDYSIYDLNEKQYISSERFKEFETAYSHFANTKKFELDLSEKIKDLTKPILYVEGDYDIRYINYVAERLGKTELLEQIEIIDGDGSGNLKNLWKVFDRNKAAKISELITNQKILFLFDCDEKESEKDLDSKIFKVSIPHISDNLIKIGIENLLSDNVIIEASEKGYIEYSKLIKKSGNDEETIESYQLIKSQKSNLCNWFCTDRENKEIDIESFKTIFEIIESKLIN